MALSACDLVPATPPDWVANREPLPTCGEGVMWGDTEPRRCLLDAYLAGRDAELITIDSTLEGDPITQVFRVHENGVVEIFTDFTRDRYSSGGWERHVCEELISVEAANARHDQAAYDPHQVFVEEGCREEPVP